MVDPTTVNTSLAIPIRGSDVGTWDLPVNGNFNAIDSMFGGVTTIALAAANVTLLSTQGQQAVIRFTGTLANDVQVVLPNIIKGWTVDNRLTNSPSTGFVAQIVTPGSSFGIGAAPSNSEIYYDGVGIYYRNLERVGTYVDFAGSQVPRWVSFCSGTQPYLLCNGTTFSSATYPILTSLLGSTTLPDARGRVRMMSNQGTGRVTVFNGDTLFLGGGDQQVQAHTHTGSGTTSDVSADHTHTGSGSTPVSGTTSTESVFHTHTGSGTTGFVSADHSHTGSGTTSVEQQGFNFNFSGTTSDISANHTHSYTRAFSNGVLFDTGITTTVANGTDSPQTGTVSNGHTHTYSGTTGTQNQNHTHTYSFTTSGISANHTHTYSFTSANQSVLHTHTFSASGAYSFTTSGASNGHTHTYSFTTASFGAGASLNMQPTYVGGITMIRAA